MLDTITLNADGTLSSEIGEAHLTNKELALLVAVMSRKGGILTKQAGLTELYGGMDEPEVKIIDVFICKVRRKLNEVGAPDAIETVWGHGYRWNKAVKCLTPDGGFLSMETEPELTERIEDLALALNCNVATLLHRIVTDNLDRYEEEAWA